MEETLKLIFVSSKIAIENTTTYMESVFTFLVMLHMFTCAWIWVGFLDNQWMGNGDDHEVYMEDKGRTYAEAFYFISTTMT